MADIAKVVKIVVDLAAEFEGLELKPYLCSSGVPTIGYGTTFYPNGQKVTLQDPEITETYARFMRDRWIEKVCIPAVLKLVKVELTDNRLAALADFVYNIGEEQFRTSTLLKVINAGEWDKVPAQLERWIYSKGKKMPGLIRRRKAEIALI